MNYLKPIITASAALLLLNACSSDSDSTTAADGTEIRVATISGVTAGLNGTYSTGCHGDGGGSVNETLEIAGNTWNYTSTGYASADCSGTGTDSTIAATISADADTAITGWVDGVGDSVPGPDAADASGAIGDSETVTPLTATISASTGDFAGIPANTTSPLFYVVDDTGANNILYRDDDFENGSTLAGDFDPYTKQ